MEPLVDHIQITVKDIKSAEAFYDQFFALIGFDVSKKGSAVIEEHDFEVVEYSHPLLAFAITSPRQAFKDEDVNRRRPGSLHHLAFKAKSHGDVDRLYEELKKIGATIVTPPKLYPEYKPENYYAVFFKDPDGIKYEIVSSNP